jgi:hypothetical protein
LRAVGLDPHPSRPQGGAGPAQPGAGDKTGGHQAAGRHQYPQQHDEFGERTETEHQFEHHGKQQRNHGRRPDQPWRRGPVIDGEGNQQRYADDGQADQAPVAEHNEVRIKMLAEGREIIFRRHIPLRQRLVARTISSDRHEDGKYRQRTKIAADQAPHR